MAGERDASIVDPLLERFRESVERRVPHNTALGLRFVAIEGSRISVELPYDERLVGNPETGVLHGGAITALMDATSGTAVFAKILQPIPIATLDLRIDYLAPARPGLAVIARAECVKATHSIAFVRCEAFHREDPAELIALANGTFMIFRGKKFKSERGPI